jgi:hypothetical protein
LRRRSLTRRVQGGGSDAPYGELVDIPPADPGGLFEWQNVDLD